MTVTFLVMCFLVWPTFGFATSRRHSSVAWHASTCSELLLWLARAIGRADMDQGPITHARLDPQRSRKQGQQFSVKRGIFTVSDIVHWDANHFSSFLVTPPRDIFYNISVI